MSADEDLRPEHTAARVALWRALHVLIDDAPHVLTDTLGMKLLDEENWRDRQDMDPEFSKPMRASIVGRARFIEDLVQMKAELGTTQYVILGAGLDTFAQRRPEVASRIQIFEIDQPGPQAWKQRRLSEVGYNIPDSLRFVPVDFESGQSWWSQLLSSGFDNNKPSLVVSTGVSMYLTMKANVDVFHRVASMAPGSTIAMTFMLTLDLLSVEERRIMEFVMKKAKQSGTPFISLFTPSDIVTLAKEAGFKAAEYISGDEIFQRYFTGRSDGLRPGAAEGFLLATTGQCSVPC